MKVYGRASLSEFLGDRIVYRNLEACDPRLPALRQAQHSLGMPEGEIPRKSDAAYARVVMHLLKEARCLEAPGTTIRRLIYLGDTRLSDGTAYENLCAAGDWPGRGFIGSEDQKPPAWQVLEVGPDRTTTLSNRWAGLTRFADNLAGFPVDEGTAVVIDMDKTAIGARGRNAGVIDGARVSAVYDTVAGLLGKDFNRDSFQAAYDQLNQPEFHPFTADNQDYLAYICLILGSGVVGLNQTVDEVRSGKLSSFHQFIELVNQRLGELPTGLATVHEEIFQYVQAGDPTPFKPFRRREYLVTTGRMGFLSDDTPVETMLKKEIVITQEVRALALKWAAQGALIFALSDKPDEASIPIADIAAQGHLPIHRTETHIVGE